MLRNVCLGWLICGLWLLSAGQALAAGWSTPDPVVPDIQSTGYTLGMSGGGQAVAAWSDGGGIYAAVAPRGRAFGRRQVLAPTDNLNSGRMLVVDGRGDAVAFWISELRKSYGGLFVSYRAAGRSFGKPVQIAAHVSYVDAAIDANGDATFVWLGQNRRAMVLDVRQRTARGKLAKVIQLDHGTQLTAPSIAVNGPADAIVAWGSGPAQTEVIRYAVRIRGNGFGHAEHLASAGHGVANPDLGLDDNGRALVAWDAGVVNAFGAYFYREVDAVTVNLFAHRVWAKTVKPAPAPPVLRFPTSSADTLWQDGPQVSVNGRGNQLLVFAINRFSGDPTGIEVTRAGPGQSLPQPRIVATGDPDEVPASAVGAGGAAIVAWDDESGLVPDMATVAPKANTPFGRAQPISSPADDSGAPVVASDGRGDVAALWQDLGSSAASNSALTPSPLEFAALDH